MFALFCSYNGSAIAKKAKTTIWAHKDAPNLHDKKIETPEGDVPARVFSRPQEIADNITSDDGIVFIYGVNSLKDSSIATLARELALSKRRTLVVDTIEDHRGDDSPGNLEVLLYSADVLEHQHTTCTYCSRSATHTRQVASDVVPVCHSHWPGATPLFTKHLEGQPGSIEFFVSETMCSGKTLELNQLRNAWKRSKLPYILIKTGDDTRGGNDTIKIHYQEMKMSGVVPISTAQELQEIVERSKVHAIGLDELQFMPEGVDRLLVNFASSGYLVAATILTKVFNRKPFILQGRKPLLHLADRFTELHTHCETCGHRATVTQRYKTSGQGGNERVPAPYNDVDFQPGANQYQPKCDVCVAIPGELPKEFSLPEFEWRDNGK